MTKTHLRLERRISEQRAQVEIYFGPDEKQAVEIANNSLKERWPVEISLSRIGVNTGIDPSRFPNRIVVSPFPSESKTIIAQVDKTTIIQTTSTAEISIRLRNPPERGGEIKLVVY